MIQPASKYQAVRREPPQRTAPVQTSGRPPHATRTTQHATIALPVFKRTRGLNVLVPKFRPVTIRWDEFMDKELREGGYLNRYLRRERHQSIQRQRAVARKMHGWKQNMKSDFELKAAIPAREFFRLKEMDPDFFLDDKNLKSLKRDNPDIPIFV